MTIMSDSLVNPGYAIDGESIQAYRNRVMVYATDLWHERDQEKRFS